MKKIKLISAVSLAGALVLSGCGHTHTFAAEWLSNDEQHWHASTCGHNVVDSLGNHVDSDLDGLCDVCDRKIGDPVIDPAVTSVSISGSVAKLDLGQTVTLTANVIAVGGANNGVDWSVNDPSLASLSDNPGKTVTITAKKEGNLVVTAKSKFDPTKSAQVEIQILDRGFDPSWIDVGYTYSKAFPVDAIKQFLGDGSYDVVEPDELEGGCYYKVYAADEQGPACIEIVLDGIVYEDYAEALYYEGFERVYQTADGYEAVDPTKKYTVSMEADFDDDEYEEIAPTFIEFFKSEDVWADGTLTDDTSWSLSHISEESEEFEELISSYLAVIPFVQMGAEYEINYVDNSMYRALIEAFGGDPSEYPDQFYICDYTIRDDIFDGYDQVLAANGYEEFSDENGVYFVKNAGIDAHIIYTDFGEGGNTLYYEKSYAILDAWPEDAVASFVLDEIESKYSVPAFAGDEGALYAMQISSEQISETEFMSVADIQVSASTKEKFDAYMDALDTAGFEVEYTAGTDKSYPLFEATKGKIVLEGIFYENYDSSTKTYDPNNGAVKFYLYGDSEAHEDPGIYLPASLKAVLKDGEFVLPLEVVELESPDLTAVSSDEGVATVEVTADGVKVTPVAVGETTITVSVNETEYEASTVLTVIDKTLFEQEMEKVNEVFFNLGAETPLELPEIPCSDIFGQYLEDDGYYQIMIDTTVDPDDYADTLEGAGFEMSLDEWGYPIASKDGYSVGPWDYQGYFILDIYYGSSSDSDGVTFDYSELSETTNTIGDFTVDCHKTGGEAAPVVQNHEELRMYAGNALVISSDGEPITSIDFYTCDCTSKVGATFKADCGTLTSTSYGYHWEGNTDEVTFSCTKVDDDHKQVHFFYIDINGGSEGGGGDVPVGGESAEDIMSEIAYNIFEDETAYKSDGEGGFYTAAQWGSTSEYDLVSAIEEFAMYCLPDSICYVLEEPALGTWSDGDDGGFAEYCNEDGSVIVDVGTYLSGSYVILQVNVYEAE